MSYRDSFAAIREQVETMRRGVFARSRRLGYAHRALLPDRGAAVEELHDRAMPFLLGDLGSTEDAHRALAAIEQLSAAYDAALAKTAPLLVAGDLPGGIVPDTKFEHGYSREDFIEKGAPIVAWYGQFGEGFAYELATSVPLILASFTARPQQGVDSLLGTVGLASEVRIGSCYFDESYWIRGDADVASAALPTKTQDLMLLALGLPSISLADGILRLQGRMTAPPIPPQAIAAVVFARAELLHSERE